jgi:hypothetical protein
MAHLKFNVASNPKRSKGSRPPAGKKGSHMAKAAKKKKANGGRHKKANSPAMHRKRRRNPSGIGAIIGSPRELFTGGTAGLVSAVATRQVPQMILGASNTGIEGYAANLVTTLIATWAAGTFMGPAAGKGALIGGMVILLDRVLSEQVSPISSYLSLSGVGDANAYSKLGTIRQGYYTHPNLQNPDGSMYVPDPITDAAMQAVLAKYPQLAAPMAQAASGGGRVGAVNPSSLRRHVANGMLMSSRFQGRFNQ